MIYPKFITKNDTIDVTAISDGITSKEKLYRLDNAIKNMEGLNFKVKETPNVRTSEFAKSTSSKEQAHELISLFKDKDVKAIILATGGEFAALTLPFIDFETIKNNPKWIQGYSDPTNILFTITTNLDIATIYANNFAAFGMNPWHKSLTDNLEILKGNIIKQESFKKYEGSHQKYLTGTEPYKLTRLVKWQNLFNEDNITIKGRIIGGCIDCINDLFGTRFDNTINFIEKYKNDGIIWYFDNCELSNEQLIRTLHKFKDTGWFKHCKGIIFGRCYNKTSWNNISFEDALTYILKDLKVPVIINADLGHISPRMTIINGSIAQVTSSKGKGSITFTLE